MRRLLKIPNNEVSFDQIMFVEELNKFDLTVVGEGKIVEEDPDLTWIMTYDDEWRICPVKWLSDLNTPRCECGANHTSFPNHHMFYCALYKGEKNA